jgi:hypothetical protein
LTLGVQPVDGFTADSTAEVDGVFFTFIQPAEKSNGLVLFWPAQSQISSPALFSMCTSVPAARVVFELTNKASVRSFWLEPGHAGTARAIRNRR